MTALVGHLHVHSTEEQEEVVTPWDTCLRQVSPGAFEGRMQYASLGDILIYRDCWSQRTAASAVPPGDYLMFGAGARPTSGIDWCGKSVNEQLLALAPPGAQVDFVMPALTPYVVMLLPVRYLHTVFGDGTSRSLPANFHHYACHPVLGRRLLVRLNWIIDHCLENPGLLEDPAQRNEIEVCLIDDMAEMGFGTNNEPHHIGRSARRQTLRHALEYGESVRDKISVPEFAAQLAVNRRSLELAFRECLGITPRQYLNYRRLHGVHGELRRLSPGSRCITKVANSWGFTELGRFAGEYNSLFGELPSATLKRATTRAPRRLVDLMQ